MGKLDGKVAIVTGGARGIGAAVSRLFVQEGAKVVLTDVRSELGEDLAKELGENAKFVIQDVTKETEWQHLVSEAESTFGPVNILVNNAGIAKFNLIPDISEADYRSVIDVNQVGVFLGMKSVFPSMEKTGNGSIVNISSGAGLQGSPYTVAYVASKFAVTGMTQTAAHEFAQYGIRVNSVHPGYIETPINHQEDTEPVVGSLPDEVPMKRGGTPEEVAKMVLFLASDDSSYSSGSKFVIDGGAMPF